MQIPIFLEYFIPIFLNLKVLALSSKYSIFSNMQTYVIENT